MKDWKHIEFYSAEAAKFQDGKYIVNQLKPTYLGRDFFRRKGSKFLNGRYRNMFTTKKIVYKLLEYEDI